jgi:hypothetical protein
MTRGYDLGEKEKKKKCMANMIRFSGSSTICWQKFSSGLLDHPGTRLTDDYVYLFSR